MAAAVLAPVPILSPSKAYSSRTSLHGPDRRLSSVGYNPPASEQSLCSASRPTPRSPARSIPRHVTPAPFNTTLDYIGTVRGRVGYAFGTVMPYLTGGFAWGHSHIDINDAAEASVASPGQYQSGWTAGAGVEFAVSGNLERQARI